jgi:VIT1/CCC1 family predicted Fe2+/Mn2+ transporter
MTQTQENIKVGGIESKTTRIGLLVITALLLFVGPTYVPYFISDNYGGAYVASVLVGLVLFLAGIGMLVYLIKKKIIS